MWTHFPGVPGGAWAASWVCGAILSSWSAKGEGGKVNQVAWGRRGEKLSIALGLSQRGGEEAYVELVPPVSWERGAAFSPQISIVLGNRSGLSGLQSAPGDPHLTNVPHPTTHSLYPPCHIRCWWELPCFCSAYCHMKTYQSFGVVFLLSFSTKWPVNLALGWGLTELRSWHRVRSGSTYLGLDWVGPFPFWHWAEWSKVVLWSILTAPPTELKPPTWGKASVEEQETPSFRRGDPSHGTPLWGRVRSSLKPLRTKSWLCNVTKPTFMHAMQHGMTSRAISINMYKLYVAWHFESLQLEIKKCRMKVVLKVDYVEFRKTKLQS